MIALIVQSLADLLERPFTEVLDVSVGVVLHVTEQFFDFVLVLREEPVIELLEELRSIEPEVGNWVLRKSLQGGIKIEVDEPARDCVFLDGLLDDHDGLHPQYKLLIVLILLYFPFKNGFGPLFAQKSLS